MLGSFFIWGAKVARLFGLFALIIGTFFVNVANAQEAQTYAYAGDLRWMDINSETTFNVKVLDDVKDGCWTSASATKTGVELELQRSNYTLDEKNANYTVYIYGLGYGTKAGLCVVNYSIEVWGIDVSERHIEGNNLMSFFNSRLWRDNGVMSQGKVGVSNSLKEYYIEMIQSFLVNVGREKQRIKDKIVETGFGDSKEFWANYKF